MLYARCRVSVVHWEHGKLPVHIHRIGSISLIWITKTCLYFFQSSTPSSRQRTTCMNCKLVRHRQHSVLRENNPFSPLQSNNWSKLTAHKMRPWRRKSRDIDVFATCFSRLPHQLIDSLVFCPPPSSFMTSLQRNILLIRQIATKKKNIAKR